jgi:hypothetical protein
LDNKPYDQPMIKYLRLSLLSGFREIVGRPVAWISSLFGLLGIPGILTWTDLHILTPYAVVIAACLVLCAALVSGGYQLHQDDRKSLMSGMNERRRVEAQYAEELARRKHAEELAAQNTTNKVAHNSGPLSGVNISNNQFSNMGGHGMHISYQGQPPS